ncbi:hypothetical protein [Streptomyces sp. NPDC004286]|uniref:hypothetical protein n=1 Tax=Streptomyces sp. NPDC004286 TaxID=3364696 RepID=UPI0036C7E045
MKLKELSVLMARREDGRLSYEQFRADHAMAPLRGWPDDVVQQFLFDHGDNAAFVRDYGGVDLCTVTWELEAIPVADFVEMPTGNSDAGCIEHYAEDPEWWISVRPPQIGRHWEEHGTWLRPPILIDRCLLDPAARGLQVLEGRTRAGVLRGRLHKGLHVASHHQAWVGRASGGRGITASV